MNLTSHSNERLRKYTRTISIQCNILFPHRSQSKIDRRSNYEISVSYRCFISNKQSGHLYLLSDVYSYRQDIQGYHL